MPTFIEPILFEKLKKAQALPSPSGVRLTVMLLCAQDHPDMDELLRLVQADPMLAGRIIRIVNVINADRVRPVASVSMDKLLLVGLQAIRQLALALSLAVGQAPLACLHFNLPRFWAQSFAMACGAQSIASRTNVAPLAEMFTTGLLANMGELALASAHPAAYSSLLARKLDNRARLAMEQSLFGWNHLNVAAALMQDWKIPLLFCDAALHHETPEDAHGAPRSRGQEITWTLHLASTIAELACGATQSGKHAAHRISTALGHLHLGWDDFMAIYRDAGLDWKDWAQSMNFGNDMRWQDLPEDASATQSSEMRVIAKEKSEAS